MKGPESRSPGDFAYHYNREEREARLPDYMREERKKGFWGRNRHLMIIFIDILVISLVFMFLLPYIRQGNHVLGGYSFSMKVVNFDGMILTSLKAEVNPEGDMAASASDVTVTFRVLPEGRQMRVYDYLQPDRENLIRGRIPLREGDELVRAEISFNNETLIMEETIPPE
ncbi:hypothetical protein [Marispirochaeta aestuarii]|uniref:hypothetical protein n=1 Tax=Marispirochaeta aestuarii TaxID=1963862 RepID=UPI002ABD67EB|nr:hypothetical protein [Marispirochaeta aestuarii]